VTDHLPGNNGWGVTTGRLVGRGSCVGVHAIVEAMQVHRMRQPAGGIDHSPVQRVADSGVQPFRAGPRLPVDRVVPSLTTASDRVLDRVVSADGIDARPSPQNPMTP
jgi:hypothetical protein